MTELIRAYRLDGILADLRSASSASDTINQVAARWGLHDMPHLTRAFRARFGMTPSQARLVAPPAHVAHAAHQPGESDPRD